MNFEFHWEHLHARLAHIDAGCRADFIGFLVAHEGVPVELLPPDVMAALELFAGRVGLGDSDTPEVLADKVNRYFRAHPVDGELLRVFTQLAQSIETDDVTHDARRDACAVFLGGRTRTRHFN